MEKCIAAANEEAKEAGLCRVSVCSQHLLLLSRKLVAQALEDHQGAMQSS